MPVVPEKRGSGGFVREGAFYNGSAGCVPMVFLALLELLRQHRVIIYQNAAFHEITILASKEEPEDKPLEKPDDYE